MHTEKNLDDYDDDSGVLYMEYLIPTRGTPLFIFFFCFLLHLSFWYNCHFISSLEYLSCGKIFNFNDKLSYNYREYYDDSRKKKKIDAVK